jgi:hypothetical protein
MLRLLAAVLAAVLLAAAAPGQERRAGGPIAEFVAAYQRAGSPRLLVYADFAGGTSARSAAGAQAVRALGAEVERALSVPGVSVVRASTMKPLTPDQLQALRSGESFAGARMLGNAADADMVLYLRVVETAQAGYTGTYVLADLRRGAALGRYAWDMVPGEDGAVEDATIRARVTAIVAKVSEQVARAYPPGGSPANARRAVVRIAGSYTPADLTALRAGLNAAPGVKEGSALLRAEDRTGPVHVATLDVVFGGDIDELRRLVHRTIIDQMGMASDPIDAREGAVAMRLSPLPLSSREKMLVGGVASNRSRAERDRLTLAYANAGSPKVGVLFCRAQAEPPAGGAARVEVGQRSRATPSGLGRDTVVGAVQAGADAMVMLETAVAERMTQLGVQVSPLAPAQERLAASPEFKEKAWEDRDLAVALGREGGVDVVVCGVVTTGGGKVRLTVRAFDVKAGEALERVEVEGDLPVDEGASLNRRAEELAAVTTGRLMTLLSDRWEAMPRK